MLLVGLVLLAYALAVDFPRTARGFKGDESTYYSLTYSLARDFDFTYTRADLIRVWDEFPAGPEGIFLKRGRRLTIDGSDSFPWVQFTSSPDPRTDRLYYGKSYIYPLAAAPFVWLLGTNGFLVFHAVLFVTCLAAAISWLLSRGSSPFGAVAYAAVFFGASVVPVYFVWLTPELFNFSLVLLAYFLWTYKDAAARANAGVIDQLLRHPASDYLGAALLGIATFSKPIHIGLIGPLVFLACWRSKWTSGFRMLAVFGVTTAALFLLNLAITGELNYQGGDRKTFYGYTGFAFANERETFETSGESRATDAVPVDILVSTDAPTVLGYNLLYFVMGRHHGFLPYFFPGVVSVLLFLAGARHRPFSQWLTFATAAGAAFALLLYMPYTWSGGGGPVGNRYYLSFYPLFLFMTPAISSPAVPLVAGTIGALFTAPLVANPFAMSFDPGALAKSGPVRVLPIELTELNDLPVAARPDRSRLHLAGPPTLMGYFTDDNAYGLEDEGRFWVRGRSRADIILRAPAIDDERGTGRPLRLDRLTIEIENGLKPNEVTVSTLGARERVHLAPETTAVVHLTMGGGVPYRPMIYPTNYLYTISIASESAFVPFLEIPGSSDSRLLGARIRLVPFYRQD